MSMRSRVKTCFVSREYSSDDVVDRSETPLELWGTDGTDGTCWRSGEVVAAVVDSLLDVVRISEAETECG